MESAPDLESLPTRDPDSGEWLAVVETSQGSRNKLKYRAAWRAFELAHVLPLGTAFPYDFGFLPSTLGEDGDPLDVLLFADEALVPGSIVSCRVVGVIEAEQQDAPEPGQPPGSAAPAERNDRLLAVASASHRWRDCRDIGDIAGNVLDEIEHFFMFYNRQRSVRFRPLGRHAAAAAERLIEEGRARHAADRLARHGHRVPSSA